MWEWDHKGGWVPKNWCFWTVVLEKTLESPLDCSEIKPVKSKGNQPWIVIGRTDAEAEAPILWPPDTKCQPIGKDPDAGKDWGHEEKGANKMRQRLDGIINSMDMNLSKLWDIVVNRGAWHAAVHKVTKSQRWVSDWTITTTKTDLRTKCKAWSWVPGCGEKAINYIFRKIGVMLHKVYRLDNNDIVTLDFLIFINRLWLCKNTLILSLKEKEVWYMKFIFNGS